MVWRLLSISEWRIRDRAVVAVTPVPPRVVAVPATAPSGRNLKSVDAVDVGALHPALRPLGNISFVDAFGRLGFLMLVVILVSIAWTLWLLVVTVDPNGAANYLMNTTKFDDGMMWLIVNADPTLVVVNALWLGAIALAYVWDATAYSGPNRKYWNAGSKAVDLVIQFYSLHGLMEAGFPATMCSLYAAMVTVNSLSGAYFILTPLRHSIFTEIFTDAVFDMVFAVGMPIALLAVAAIKFQFDRHRAEMYLRYFPAGWFERETRLIADAAEITTFRISFDGLRTQTWRDWCIRSSINFSFCYRLLRLVEVSIHRQRRILSQRSIASKHMSAVRVRHQRKVPRKIGIVFVLFSIFVLVYVIQGITVSSKACAAYPSCVAFAYRWTCSKFCPCRALIDVDRAPTSYEDWINPLNVTGIVSDLATSGDLKVLQVINRKLDFLPETLKRCTHLQQLVLMYTGIETIPDWSTGFPKLELIAIEGRPADRNLVHLPDDLFSEMSSLMYFHLGAHPSLPRLPSFEGLSKLKTISLAMISQVTEFPAVKPLHSLERVVLAGSHYMNTLPDYSSNRHLVGLIIGDVGACCNGYFGECRLPLICAAQPVGKCSDAAKSALRPTATAQAVFDKFNSSICEFSVPTDIYLAPIVEENVRMCEGVLYRHCRRSNASAYFPNVSGMCYSDRMMVIGCMYSPMHVRIRREEIERGIGTPCNPTEEGWLGCSSG